MYDFAVFSRFFFCKNELFALLNVISITTLLDSVRPDPLTSSGRKALVEGYRVLGFFDKFRANGALLPLWECNIIEVKTYPTKSLKSAT